MRRKGLISAAFIDALAQNTCGPVRASEACSLAGASGRRGPAALTKAENPACSAPTGRFSHFRHSFSSFFALLPLFFVVFCRFPSFPPPVRVKFLRFSLVLGAQLLHEATTFFRSGRSADLRKNAPANKKEISSKITNCVRITSTFDAVFMTNSSEFDCPRLL